LGTETRGRSTFADLPRQEERPVNRMGSEKIRINWGGGVDNKKLRENRLSFQDSGRSSTNRLLERSLFGVEDHMGNRAGVNVGIDTEMKKRGKCSVLTTASHHDTSSQLER